MPLKGYDKHGRKVIVIRSSYLDHSKVQLSESIRASLMVNELMEELLEGFAVTWGLMLPQFDRDVFDTSPDKIAKVDNLHIPDLPMLHYPQNLTQNKKYSYHVYLSCNPKILRAIAP